MVVRTLVDDVFGLVEALGITEYELEAKTGIERSKLNKAKKHKRSLRSGAGRAELESIAAACGYRFRLVPSRSKRAA